MDPTRGNRFLRLLPLPTSFSAGKIYELTEDDVLWTDFSDHSNPSSPMAAGDDLRWFDRRSSLSASSGMLSALPEPNHLPLLYRRPSLQSSSSKTIPRPPGDHDRGCAKAAGITKAVNQSAPVKVPVLSAAIATERRMRYMASEDDNAVADDDEEMLPPHEMVARGPMTRSPRTTFSVLEGVGRTLKGRDLRQVRNAVWRQTGFLD